jgi:hypothetical protein
MCLILFLPYLSHTPTPPSIAGIARIFVLREVPPPVDFWPAEVDKSTKLAGFHSKSVGFQFVFVS